MSVAESLVSRLQRVSKHGKDRWRAVCPAHESKNRTQSLAIREMPDGTVLITCFAGCGALDVVGALGMEIKDLFPPNPEARTGARSQHWHALREAVQTLERDCLMVAICASDIVAGRRVTKADRDFVLGAERRIRRAVEACR